MKTGLYQSSGLVVYLVVTGLLHSTAIAKAKRVRDTYEYGPTTSVRILSLIAILVFAAMAIHASLAPPISWFGAAFFGFLSIITTWTFPPTVFLNASGVKQVRWWGSTKEIAWRDVDHIEYHKGPSRTVVIAKDGTRVVHSGWNRDTNGFLQSCEEKTGLVTQITGF